MSQTSPHAHIEQVAGKNAWVTPMAIGAVVDATPSQYKLHEVQVQVQVT